jgi:hypothetical protein
LRASTIIPERVKRFNFYHAAKTPTLALDGTTEIIGANRNEAKPGPGTKYQMRRHFGTTEHSPVGIMKTSWRKTDYQCAQAGSMEFSAAESDVGACVDAAS